jgi:hypothetical protein
VAERTAQTTEKRIAVDTDRDAVYVQAETENNTRAHEARMAELQLKERLAILDYANREKTTLENVKAKLADTAMKLNVQRELSQIAAAADEKTPRAATPPNEPAGKAPAGEGYQR